MEKKLNCVWIIEKLCVNFASCLAVACVSFALLAFGFAGGWMDVIKLM